MINFSKIKFKNFLSYGNAFTEIELNVANKTLLCGKNGFGKSTMIDAITFALYGKPFRKINKGGLVNSINKKELIAEIEFAIGSNNYKIIRGIKPNIFEIYCNDVIVIQDAKVKDYQSHLERYILKMSYKSFTQVVILGSARYTPFMQLTAADRRSVIEDLLDIQIFSNMNAIVKDKLSNLKESLQDCKYNIELYKDKIELQKRNINQNKKSSDEVISKKEYIIANTFVEVESSQSNITSLLDKNAILLEYILDHSAAEKKQQKIYGIQNKLEYSISKIEKENSFYDSNDDCPTCRQEIEEIFKQKIIDRNISKLKELEVGKMKLVEEVSSIQKRLDEIDAINRKISDNNIEISKFNSSIVSAQKYIKLISQELQELNSTVNIDGTKDLKLLVESLDNYVEKYEEYITDKTYYDFITLMLKDGGIKTKIIKQYLPILNKYINQYLSHLDFFVNFNIDENFEEVIKSRHRDEFTYSNFSEGEKMRLDLSVLFSFRQLARLKNSVNTNLLILDEVCDSSLDNSGTDLFMSLLATLDKHTNIFVISHKSDQISDKFDRMLQFDKVKNFSKMKVI